MVCFNGGNLDTDAATNLYDFLQNKFLNKETKGRYNYVLDLEKVDYISSTGFNLLIEINEHKNKFVKLIIQDKIKRLLDRHLGDLTSEFFEIKSSLDSILEEKDTNGKNVYTPFTIRLLKENKLNLRQPTDYKRKELSIMEIAVGREHVKRETELMEYYLQAANNSSLLNLKSHLKYALPHNLALQRVLSAAGIYPTKINYEDTKFMSLELMRNSFEHGYSREVNGLITLGFSRSELGDEFKIRHTDYGLGLREKEKSKIRGKGLSTIERIFGEIGGSLEISEAIPLAEESKTFIGENLRGFVPNRGVTITITGNVMVG